MAVMVLGGLWHGANWTFVLWGAMHGVYLWINHLWRDLGGPAMPKLAGRALTLAAVVFAWVPFRAPDLSTAISVWSGMIGLNGMLVSPDFAVSEALARHWPGYFHVRTVFSPYVFLHGRLAVMTIPAALLIALGMPNIYQMLARYRPALYSPPPSLRPRIAVRWRPSWPLAVGLGALAALVVVTAGASQSYLYWQF